MPRTFAPWQSPLSRSHEGGRPPQAARRLIVLCQADLSGRYEWLPAPRPGDITVALDRSACADLANRRPLLFDELESWVERSAAEHYIDELLGAVSGHSAVAAIECRGHRLIDFVGLRLRHEIACLLRGWTLARSGAGSQARELVCDPRAPLALQMGVRAGIGLDPAAIRYETAPALPGSRYKRALVRPLMCALAAGSRPGRVRIAAVAAGKLSLALASLSGAELRAAGVGAMPFPGLDHGNSALLALRRRLPLLATCGSRRVGPGPVVRLPDRLELDEAEALDRALAVLVGRLLAATAAELERAVDVLVDLERVGSLRSLVLPSAAYGASRLLIEWAHERGLQVGAMQHGIYAFREFDGGDRQADVVFGWGEGTVEQTRSWPEPRPVVLPVGVPGLATAVARRPHANSLGRALIATSSTVDTPMVPAAFCETFIDAIALGLRRLAAARVRLELRPHPNEDPARYRHMLSGRGLEVTVESGGSFSAAAANADILISSASSVAFEAAAMGLPVLLWLGGAPAWVRREHLVTPWTDCEPGMFEGADDFELLVEGLIERRGETLAVGRELGRRLARYAEPFDPSRFAAGLNALAA